MFQPMHPRQRSTGNQKDRPSALAKGLFCLPNGSGLSGLRGRLLEGRLRYLPHRIHSLFTISNTRVGSCEPQRVSLVPAGLLTNRTADLFDLPDNNDSARPHGGARRDRTDDLMLAKHALSQLSYGPFGAGLKRRRRRASPWLSRHGARRPVGLASALAGFGCVIVVRMVGLGRLERPTSPLSGVRSNHLSYRPDPQELKRSQGPGPRAQARHPITHCPDEKRETKTAASRIAGSD